MYRGNGGLSYLMVKSVLKLNPCGRVSLRERVLGGLAPINILYDFPVLSL